MSNFSRKVERSTINRKKERKMLKQIIANQSKMEQMQSILDMYKEKAGEEAPNYDTAVQYLMQDPEDPEDPKDSEVSEENE